MVRVRLLCFQDSNSPISGCPLTIEVCNVTTSTYCTRMRVTQIKQASKRAYEYEYVPYVPYVPGMHRMHARGRLAIIPGTRAASSASSLAAMIFRPCPLPAHRTRLFISHFIVVIVDPFQVIQHFLSALTSWSPRTWEAAARSTR